MKTTSHALTTMLAWTSPLVASSSSNVFATSSSELLWSDEFDHPTNSQPDAEVWSYDLGGGGWGNGEHQTYTSDYANVRVEDGYLKIIALGDSTTGYTSARIKTQDSVEFQYGTLEANISIPDTVSGLWPAFWIMGQSFPQVPWPDCGEIDIMEVGWKGIDNQRIYSAAHWEHDGVLALHDGTFDYDQPLNGGFHIYRLEWTDTMLATYVDGIEMWNMDITQPTPCTDCTEFHQPYFVLLNVAVGGGFTSDGECGGSSAAGSSSAAAVGSSAAAVGSSAAGGSSGGCTFRPATNITAPFPAEMQVDWIRLYNNGYTVLPDTPQPTPQPTPSRVEPVATTPPPTPQPSPFPTRQPTPSRVEPLGTPQPTPTPTPLPTPQPTPSFVEPLATPNPTTKAPTIPLDPLIVPDPTPAPPTPCPSSKDAVGPTPGITEPRTSEPRTTPYPTRPPRAQREPSSGKGGKGGKGGSGSGSGSGSSKRSGKGKGGSKSSRDSKRTSHSSKEALGSSSPPRLALSSLLLALAVAGIFGTL